MAVRLKKQNEFLSASVKVDNNPVNKVNTNPATEKVISDVNIVTRSEKKLVDDVNTNVTIVGDSMINGLNANGFNKDQRVKIKPFGGATLSDLLDYIKPTLRKKPFKIIIHVGTNDITNKIDTTPNLKKIVNLVEFESPSTIIAFSNVTFHDDKKDMSTKVKDLNLKIAEFCKNEHVHLINNSNITITHLSKRKLHLNQKDCRHWQKTSFCI